MKRIEEQLKEYEDSLKAYRDVKNSIDTALEKGREEGMAEEKLSTARRLLSMGLLKSKYQQPPNFHWR